MGRGYRLAGVLAACLAGLAAAGAEEQPSAQFPAARLRGGVTTPWRNMVDPPRPETEWREVLDSMRAVGMETVVLRRLRYSDRIRPLLLSRRDVKDPMRPDPDDM